MAPEETKILLLTAAKKIFASKGFDGTTVKEIADLAGVNVSLVSYHFGGKENLYRTIIQDFGIKRLSSTERILRPPQNFEDFKVRLTLFLEEFLEDATRDSEIVQIMNRECMGSHLMTTDIFRETFLKSFQLLVDFLVESQKTGCLSKGLDPELSALFVMAGTVHIVYMDPIHTQFRNQSNIHDSVRRRALIHNTIRMLTEGLAK